MIPVWRNSRRSMMFSDPYLSAKATTVALAPGLGFAGMWNAASPPPATVTTNCLPFAALVGERRHQRIVRERRPPQLLARLGVERAEPEVGRRADEHQPARRRDRAAIVHGRAGVENAFRLQVRVFTERRAPDDVAGRGADGDDLRPRRRVARIALRIDVEVGRHLLLAERRQHAGRHARLQLRDDAEVARD